MSRRPSTFALPIASTWDGRPIPRREEIKVELAFTAESLEISVDAPFFGDPPPPGAPGPTDGLWEFEVVEVFVAHLPKKGPPAYTEIELSPHGHFLVLRLEGIRNVVERPEELELEAQIDSERWRGRARLQTRYLPPAPHWANAFAIHAVASRRRYLAHQPLPGSDPDFHQPELFVRL